jgi:hypothetical protein
MLDPETLSEEFVEIATKYYPDSREILEICYVKILECDLERSGKRLYYLGIYYPEGKLYQVQKQQEIFKEIADNMGLMEVVYLNASRLVRDPLSRLKHENPRLWLELYWIALHKNHSY